MKRTLSSRDVVFIGVLSAMCVLATTIKVPFGTGAMVHLGTAMLYTTGLVFGGMYAGLAGAIGSAFFDLLMGWQDEGKGRPAWTYRLFARVFGEN